MSRWSRSIYQFQKDAAMCLFFLLCMTMFRVIFILYFYGNLNASSRWVDILQTMSFGFRFDAKSATTMMIPCVVVGFTSAMLNRQRYADKFRRVYGAIASLLLASLFVVTIGYFREYHDQFNHFIVNLYYDDTKAILGTIWTAYHPLIYLTAIIAVSALMVKVLNRWFGSGFVSHDRLAALPSSPVIRIAISLVLLALLVIGARGSWGRKPIQIFDAAISRDEFLNKAVMNPPLALYYAILEYKVYMGNFGIENFLPDRDVRRAARSLFSTTQSFDNLDEYLRKTAAGPRNRPPRHIILLFMESYDSWPLLDRYRSLNVTNNLQFIIRHGLSIDNFVYASESTMQSFATVVTSLPYTGADINFQPSALKTFPSSLAETMRRLGYRTRLFYGGFLSWHRCGEFTRSQGFDEVYGAPHMDFKTGMNSWGVQDEDLFDFALKNIDDSTPSFDVVMTMSNHSPYDVDVQSKGFPLKRFPDDIDPLVESDRSEMLKVLGHLWYADKCIGDFVRSAEKKLPGSLFAFTGDHFSRKFLNSRPTLYERSSVPFVLYGPAVLSGLVVPAGSAGSHMDVGPTLIELAAPRGFVYYSLGRNLLARKAPAYGIGSYMLIGPDFIVNMSNMELEPLPGSQKPKHNPDMNVLRTMYDEYIGIGWWRVKRGPQL
jgi:phosphoglycerol transferase MdoB-like AlkP superfamily enzyme